jgi:histidine triad (HIT) family protein
MSDCLFCKIADGRIPAKKVHEDAETVAFEDLNPQAPVHLLVIPRAHVGRATELRPENDAVMGKLFRVAASLAVARGVAEGGFRLVMNTNADAGQVIFHVHLHLLGGRTMGWPPG